MAKVFVITGPSGVGKGDPDRASCFGACPGLELSVSATTREPRATARSTRRDYHFLDREEFDRRARRASSSSTRPTAATATGRCAQRSSAGSLDGASVVLEIEVQGARQVRAAMPESVQVFIAPPSPRALRERLEGAAPTRPTQIDERLRTAELELAAQEEFPHVVVNDEIERAAAALEGIVREELGDDRVNGVRN